MPPTSIETVPGRTAVPGLTLKDVDRARQWLAGRVLATPVVRSDDLDQLAGARLWLKAESLQRGGSFKVRGALLALDRLAASGSSGVVAQSTGNHAIAVALAARSQGLPAVLVLPTDAPAAKQRRIREAGAELVLAGSLLAERLAVVDRIRAQRGYDVIDPYEDPDVVAGQATATAELLSQVSAAGGRLDAVVVPVGGGSAVAGACLAACGTDIEIIGAEPAAVPALGAALRAGGPVTVPAQPTVADGLRPDRIGVLPFSLAQGRVAGVEAVTEAEIHEALCTAAMLARLVVEPAAAVALAVALRLARASRGRLSDIGVLITGGNVEHTLVASMLRDHRDGAEAAPSR